MINEERGRETSTTQPPIWGEHINTMGIVFFCAHVYFDAFSKGWFWKLVFLMRLLNFLTRSFIPFEPLIFFFFYNSAHLNNTET